jgi:hypothetical protein
MIKYISEILSKFTPQQRLLALVLLLFTAIILALGNSIIDSFNQSDKVLQNKVKRLEVSQGILLDENDSLAITIIENEVQCSKDIADVRKKILEDLGMLERQLMSMNNQRVVDSYKMVPRQQVVPHIEIEEEVVALAQVREMPVSVEIAQPKRRMVIGGRPPQALMRVEMVHDTILSTEKVIHEKVVWDTIVVMDSVKITPQPNNTTPLMLNQIRSLKEKIKNDIQ